MSEMSSVLRNLILESDSDDDEEVFEYVLLPIKVKTFRPRVLEMECWDDGEFRARFRMSKPSVLWLVGLIQHEVRSPTDRNHAVSPIQQVLLALRFYATGAFQQCTGDLNGLHKTTVSKVVFRVSQAICKLRKQFIKMPKNPSDVIKCVQGFYKFAKFPNIIGAIDCTHVPILNPGGDVGECFRNRKDTFSFNVQAVVNHAMVFTNIVARWPGSSHDSTIFNQSRLGIDLKNGEYGKRYLVGDGGYGVKPYMMTPLRDPRTPAEKLYNESQIRSRNVVERTFGVWKRRFPAIGSKLRINVKRVEATIVATAILHNMCILRHELEFGCNSSDTEDSPGLPAVIDDLGNPSDNQQSGKNLRDHIIHNHFSRLIQRD